MSFDEPPNHAGKGIMNGFCFLPSRSGYLRCQLSVPGWTEKTCRPKVSEINIETDIAVS